MNNIIQRVVMTLFLFASGVYQVPKANAHGLELRPVVNIRFDQKSESAQLVPEKALVTRKLVAPSVQASTAQYISFGIGLYPEFDGVPIVAESVKFNRVSFTIWTVAKDGTLGYTSFKDSGLAAFAHESGGTSGFVFTTSSASSIEPNSPAGGGFKNATVQNVGAIYLSRMAMNFGEFPRWSVPNLDEGYQMDFKFDLEVRYGGVTKSVVLDSRNGLSAQYLVSNRTPEIVGIRPATASSPEVITTKGEFVRQFRMKWSGNLGPLSEWQLILPPPTVQILDGQLAEWILPDMPVLPARYYVLEWTPEPQFWVPQ